MSIYILDILTKNEHVLLFLFIRIVTSQVWNSPLSSISLSGAIDNETMYLFVCFLFCFVFSKLHIGIKV